MRVVVVGHDELVAHWPFVDDRGPCGRGGPVESAWPIVVPDDFCQPCCTFPFGWCGLPLVDDPVGQDFGQRWSVKEAFETGVERVALAAEADASWNL